MIKRKNAKENTCEIWINQEGYKHPLHWCLPAHELEGEREMDEPYAKRQQCKFDWERKQVKCKGGQMCEAPITMHNTYKPSLKQ